MLQTFEHALQVANPHPPHPAAPDPPRHLRGSISGFSASSRRRLLRLLSTVRTSALPPARFVTLTWHRVPPDWLHDARAFLQYIRRRGGLYLWRLEAQRRGAPHYHLIVWCADWDSADAAATWNRIAAHGSEAHAEHGYDEAEMEAYAQVFAYVAKYLAKRDRRVPPSLRGRRIWGASRDLPTRPTAASGPISPRQFSAVRRLASRLIRARARAAGRPRPRRTVSPRSFHLFLRAGDAERIARWAGVELLDPLWTDIGALDLADAFAPRPPPSPAPAGWHRDQAHLFAPAPAALRG